MGGGCHERRLQISSGMCVGVSASWLVAKSAGSRIVVDAFGLVQQLLGICRQRSTFLLTD